MALSFGASTDAHAFGDLHRLRSEYSIAELCRRDGTAESFDCGWSKIPRGREAASCWDTARAAATVQSWSEFSRAANAGAGESFGMRRRN